MRPLKSIHFIDDNLISNIIHEKILLSIRPEIEVRTCLDSAEELQHLKQLIDTDIAQFPDILFLDLNMPEMNGWEFLEELKKFPEFILRECRVYMLSSSIDNGDLERARDFTILRDFISKSLTIDKLQTLFSSQHHFVTGTF